MGGTCLHAGDRKPDRLCGNVLTDPACGKKRGKTVSQTGNDGFRCHGGGMPVCVSSVFAGIWLVTVWTAAVIILRAPAGRSGR